MKEEITVQSIPAVFAGDGFEVGDLMWFAEARRLDNGQKVAARGRTEEEARLYLEIFIAETETQ